MILKPFVSFFFSIRVGFVEQNLTHWKFVFSNANFSSLELFSLLCRARDPRPVAVPLLLLVHGLPARALGVGVVVHHVHLLVVVGHHRLVPGRGDG